ncbi:cell division cycle protein 123 [Aspergillus udagawae]|nr:cell division cycle protein 123 [Aspergillus udagawae]
MPLLDPDTQAPAESSAAQLQRLPFPPVTYSHILHCSYHHWQPRYRTLTPKSRAIPLTPSFVSYLRADGIVLPPETPPPQGEDELDTSSDDGADEEPDPSVEWQEIHSHIRSTISEFGGKVTPKLNWSAPKDAVWMSATNDLQCRTPNDIYLLLKSSDFITHDLEHPFDGCVPDTSDSSDTPATQPDIPYHLVLRKYVNFNPSLEFRCFVRNRVLLCMCQRDQNHFDFLFSLRDTLRSRIQAFFDDKLKDTFPDPNFVFDVYIPEPHQRVWLIDINPWADRTDPLLFSWLEILQMKDPIGIKEEDADSPEESFVRLSLNGANPIVEEVNGDESSESEEEEELERADDGDDSPFLPEFRLVKRDDPEAYSFSTPQYSAHKLPREVVDASLSGPGGMSEFLGKWQDILAKQTQEDTDSDDGR